MRFLHLSDSHLGDSIPIYYTPPYTWRGEAFIKNYNKALEPATKGNVDFVIHSGDLFDKYHINIDIISKAMVPLRKIAKREIPVFIIPGNHEKEHMPGGLLLADENLHVFTKPDSFEFELGKQKIVIAGFPYINRNARFRFTEMVNRTGWIYKKDAINILICHQTFEGARIGRKNFTFRNGENVVPLRSLPKGFDYIACGHIHKRQIIRTKNTQIVYPGSTERVTFQEMDEEKGYYIVDFKERKLNPQFKRIEPTKMMVMELDVTGLSDKEIANIIEKQISSVKHSTILRFHLNGEIESEILNRIPLYIYKKERNDIKIEFRKRNLVILKAKRKYFYVKKGEEKRGQLSIPAGVPIEDIKKSFNFNRKDVENVPSSRGIYQLLSKDGRVFYTGKAKDLRNRLLTHLRTRKKKDGGFYFWLNQVLKTDIVTTGDEFSSLLLELSLIRGDLPPYNKQIKEFNNYVYLVLKKNKRFPILEVVDEIINDGNIYFGPFRKKYRIKESLRFIREIFGIRPCRVNLDDGLRLFSCYKEEIGECDAPCTGGISVKEYDRRVQKLENFLYGYDDGIIKELEKERLGLVEIREFEKASRLNKRIGNVRIIFNLLRRIRQATKINGNVNLNLGNGDIRTFSVKSGRVVWDEEQKGKIGDFSFPPKKWELDEVMLISEAASENNDSLLIQ